MHKGRLCLSRWCRFTTLLFAVAATAVYAEEPAKDTELDRLEAFAKIYGYVRFFHPSDQAAAVDWLAFAVQGVKQVREREGFNSRELMRTIFSPVAPTVGFAESATALPSLPSMEGRPIFWQHAGVRFGTVSVSRRVIPGSTGATAPVFAAEPAENAVVEEEIGPGLWITLPVVLLVDETGQTLPPTSDGLSELQAKLQEVRVGAESIGDPNARIAGVIIVWNTIQHFSPYREYAREPWDAVLPRAIVAARDAVSEEGYARCLLEMLAVLGDGHGFLMGLDARQGGLLLRLDHVEGRVVVTGTPDESPFVVGDVIESIDGRTAEDELKRWESQSPGSPQLSRYRALNRFGAGPIGSVAEVVIDRAGVRKTLRMNRPKDTRNYFSNGIAEGDRAPIEEIEEGIFYVHLQSVSKRTFLSRLPELAAARGIVFDDRKNAAGFADDYLDPNTEILPRLTDAPLQGPPSCLPWTVEPNQKGVVEHFGYAAVTPLPPRIRGKVVFITDASAVSSGETTLAYLDHYKLAVTVGATTAGCNGFGNLIPVPGGFKVSFTQAKILKHDGSRLYLDGYAPHVPVQRTITGIRAGRDEVLEGALRVVREE